jgi:hypothetical protein
MMTPHVWMASGGCQQCGGGAGVAGAGRLLVQCALPNVRTKVGQCVVSCQLVTPLVIISVNVLCQLFSYLVSVIFS